MTVSIERLTPERFNTCLPELIALLEDVVNGGASVNFIAPMDSAIAASYWSRVEREMASGDRIVLIALDDGRVIGTVHLSLAGQPNGLHRAEVQKLLVHTSARGKGTGKVLMVAVEQAAKDAGRSLLVLDTEKGSLAESLYAKVGYQRAGEIPRFASNFDGTDLITTVLFYRLI